MFHGRLLSRSSSKRALWSAFAFTEPKKCGFVWLRRLHPTTCQRFPQAGTRSSPRRWEAGRQRQLEAGQGRRPSGGSDPRRDEVEWKSRSTERRWPITDQHPVPPTASRSHTAFTPDLWAAPPNLCEEWWKGGAPRGDVRRRAPRRGGRR
jgi:hypothetical protein